MADDPRVADRLDGSHINISQDYEVRYWCEKLGVTDGSAEERRGEGRAAGEARPGAPHATGLTCGTHRLRSASCG